MHRKILEWEWYDDVNVFRLFTHLLLTVNHKDSRYMGKVIVRGQRVSGLPKLSEETGLSVQELRTSLKKLKSTGEITVRPTAKYSVITICNFDKYQDMICDDQQANQQADQQSGNRRSTTSKEVKNERNKEIKRVGAFAPPTHEMVDAYCHERGGAVDAQKFLDHYEANGWMVGRVKMKDWKAAVRKWEGNEKKQINGSGKKLTARQRYMAELGELLEAADGIETGRCATNFVETAEPLPGIGTQRPNHNAIGG